MGGASDRDVDEAHPRRRLLLLALLAPGVLVLLVEPCRWLVTTWFDVSWDSPGEWIALACAGLVLRSVASGPAAEAPGSGRTALRALMATALVRLAGRLLAINIVGALALAIDVWAIGVALRLHVRPKPLDPRWLAALFALSLPMEQVLQRVAGFPLRQVASVLAGGLLGPLYPAMERRGTLLTHEGLALSVDLPCSGAQGLVLMGVLALAVAAVRRPGVRGLAALAVAALGGAILANTLRIVLLFAGLHRHLDLMAEPAHSLVGLLALAMGALPLLAVAQRLEAGPSPAGGSRPSRRPFAARPALRPIHVAALTALAVAVLAVPGRPLDVSAPVAAPALPTSLGAWTGQAMPLEGREQAYFARFGGGAARTVYRDGLGEPMVALVVRTTAPLRHLHGPDRCLLGAGHRVERLGVLAEGLPVVVWRSTGPGGDAWRVETLFVSDRGETAATVSEVVWLWAARPGATWSLVERVSPWAACGRDPARCDAFADALHSALDLPPLALPIPPENT
jgi:exosortase/archaeosortase family protein